MINISRGSNRRRPRIECTSMPIPFANERKGTGETSTWHGNILSKIAPGRSRWKPSTRSTVHNPSSYSYLCWRTACYQSITGDNTARWQLLATVNANEMHDDVSLHGKRTFDSPFSVDGVNVSFRLRPISVIGIFTRYFDRQSFVSRNFTL